MSILLTIASGLLKTCRRFHSLKNYFYLYFSCIEREQSEVKTVPFSVKIRDREILNPGQIAGELIFNTTRNKHDTYLCNAGSSRWTGRSQSTSPDGTTNPSVVHDFRRDPTASSVSPMVMVSTDILNLQSSHKSEPQILTTESSRCEPFTAKVLEDTKCTVDRAEGT